MVSSIFTFDKGSVCIVLFSSIFNGNIQLVGWSVVGCTFGWRIGWKCFSNAPGCGYMYFSLFFSVSNSLCLSGIGFYSVGYSFLFEEGEVISVVWVFAAGVKSVIVECQVAHAWY